MIAFVALALVVLQYTPYALLPAARTDTLWGLLVGVTVAGLFLDPRWAVARRHRAG